MTTDEFWNVMDGVKQRSPEQSERATTLAEELKKRTPEQVEEFFRLYLETVDKAYSWELWGAAYVMMGGCSDDSFDYFRDWLISEGRSTYESAIRDPDSLAETGRLVEFPELEELRYVPLAVYEEKTGRELRYPSTSGPFEPTGESWAEDTVYLNYPRLSEMYLENPLG